MRTSGREHGRWIAANLRVEVKVGRRPWYSTTMLKNLLTAVDILFNRGTYIRQMRANGFVVGEWTTRRELISFFRS